MSEAVCTVIKDGRIWESDLSGLRPLMNWLNNEPEVLKDSYVIDKIVGKASALLLTYGGAARIHGKTMSKAADEILTRYGIEHSWDVMADYIINRDGTDMCPMEKKILDVSEPQQAFEIFRAMFEPK